MEVKIIKRNQSKPNNWSINQTTVREKLGFFVIQHTRKFVELWKDRCEQDRLKSEQYIATEVGSIQRVWKGNSRDWPDPQQ